MARFDDTFGPQTLPMDALAMDLESRGLWRRASQRWLVLLAREPDMRRAEAIAFRRTWCLRQSQSRQVKEPAVVMTENDRVHLHARAEELGCGSVSRHWIEYF
ncbi:TPA: PerC family transcriptional regulator [Serratia marcescens]|uniref:PerC family transcriptional regulator n=1 Tax=Serratia marcescens TaxID=615 RepID=UPI0029CEC8DB|nr:PerC family transcriptional regulator [Serratia marcescens]